MTDRDRLIEVMARGICSGHLEDPDVPDNNVADCVFLPNWTRYKMDVYDALAAAERAGFEFCKKESGDG